MNYIQIGGFGVTERQHQELLTTGDKYGIPRKDAEDLFLAVTHAGGYDSDTWDYIEGVEAVLKAGFRRVEP